MSCVVGIISLVTAFATVVLNSYMVKYFTELSNECMIPYTPYISSTPYTPSISRDLCIFHEYSI